MHRLAAASFVLMVIVLLTLMGCASSNKPDAKAAPDASAPSPERLGFEQARALFAARGVQPGQPLPALSLVDLDGRPAPIAALQNGRPLLLVTASLTCNVARRQQKDVDALRDRFGDKVSVIVVYTIDAHPKTDVCPYTGAEWVPKDNERDSVLVRQPTDLPQRLEVARQYQRRFSDGATVVVDGMDNAAWIALGQAPNLGLLVDREGIVRVRQGWFDVKAMTDAILAMAGD